MRSSKITMNYWKSISQENQSAGKNLRGRNSSGFASCSQSIMAAPKWPWHSTVDGCGDRAVPADWGTGGAAYAAAFSRLIHRLRPAACLSTVIQRNAAPAGYGGPGRKEKLKITEMRIPSKGKCSDEHRLSGWWYPSSDSVGLNDVLGTKPGSLVKGGARTPSPCCGRRLRRKRQRKRTAAGRSYATCGY